MIAGPRVKKKYLRHPKPKSNIPMSTSCQNMTAMVFRFAHVSSGCDTSWTKEEKEARH